MPDQRDNHDHAAAAPHRRRFLTLATTAMAGTGLVIAAWPFLDQMNPAANIDDPLDIDVSQIEEGQTIRIVWQNTPVFIRHRTPAQIAMAQAVTTETLGRSASLFEPDHARVQRPEWLIVVGVCTKSGCVLIDDSDNTHGGSFYGWFCPCCASHYDGSGRIRKGPAPANLVIPPYRFDRDGALRFGPFA